MHDPHDESLDATAPATRFGIDFGPSSAPRHACIALASGRRYHLEVGADGRDHLLVTRADGREVARAVFDDAGAVPPVPRRAAATARLEEDTTAKVATATATTDADATADADSGQEVTWDVPRPTWAQPAEALETPRLSLECFAALSAELHVFPERARALLQRYGFADHTELMRTERAWFARMTTDEVLQRRWRDLYEVCSRWLTVVGR